MTSRKTYPKRGGSPHHTRTGHSRPTRRMLAIVIVVAGTSFLRLTPCGCKPSHEPVRPRIEGTVAPPSPSTNMPPAAVPARQTELPRLVDLGAHACIPCKMMAPILEDLRTNYVACLEVQFIDVWKNPEAGKTYGIRLIPTQIFYSASGEEKFRHEGFMSKDDILKKWAELGYNFHSSTQQEKQP